MQNYKLLCINLLRRSDRKEQMKKMFELENITNYYFYEAIDGQNVDKNHPDLKLFRHDNTSILRRGLLGCSLSHYNIWKMLISDTEHDYYVILEDDIKLKKDFGLSLEKIFTHVQNQMHFILIGMTVEKNNFLGTRNIYQDDTSFTIHLLERHLYAGGAFGYIITKEGATKLVEYIHKNGIKMAIDYLIFRSGINLFETHPHLVFTDAVQHSDYYVDSDIQRDYNKISLPMLENYYYYDDYIFFPNKDSPYNDIMELYSDIPSLKQIADSMENCVAFNTYGWLKHQINNDNEFINLRNKFYLSDGIYVKKSYLDKININKKIENIQKIIKNRPLKIFVNKNAMTYSKIFVDMILKNFNEYNLSTINGVDTKYDIIIDHITDTNSNSYCNDLSLSILISGEPWNSKYHYDISIDTKYKSNAKMTIYYPFIFLSLHEHHKSINPKDYIKEKTKFCAYMYQMELPHRICYFNLFSKYKMVDALGKCCNNVDIINTRYQYDANETYNDIAVEYYSNFKFVLAIENTMIDGYTTEKLMNPLIANSVPIYWGDSQIFKYINKKRVVYIPDFASNDDLLDHIKFLDENDSAYKAILDENIYVDPNFSIENLENELAKTIKKSLN